MNARLNLVSEILLPLLSRDESIYKKWIAFADRLLHTFITGRRIINFQGIDIVHSLILKLILQKRRWDPQKCPEFEKYFFRLIKSEVSNHAKFEEKFVDCLWEEDEYDDFDLPLNEVQKAGHKEILNNLEVEDLTSRCIKYLDGDEGALSVFIETARGGGNKKIAESLDVSLKFVSNAKKRIRRKLRAHGIVGGRRPRAGNESIKEKVRVSKEL